ncbi:MAG: TCP-1/cpn60 chaperonin family protein, partial [Methanogenium sp.]
AVKSPGFGEEKNDLLEDICCLTKSSLVSEEKGIKLVDVKQDTFGSCRKVVITKDNTTIIGGSGNVEERINQLKTHLKEVKEEYQKEKVKNRIAKLKNGVALIKVGASTEAEMKKLKLKVENSVNSTKLAFRSGVVPGAGKAFSTIKTSDEVLNEALKAPEKILKENIGEFTMNEKIVDPVEVLIASIESAVSITEMLTLTKGVIVKKIDAKE